jgi:hypothetical protein
MASTSTNIKKMFDVGDFKRWIEPRHMGAMDGNQTNNERCGDESET